MSTVTALIPELDEIVRSGDPKRRGEAVRRLGELFLKGAQNFHPEHVDLFDGVLTSLVPHAEIAARADLAERRGSPMRRAGWSDGSRMRTRSRSPGRCCADRPCSTSRC